MGSDRSGILAGRPLQLIGTPAIPGGEPEARFRAGVLHGRRQGRRLRTGQATLLTELLPSLALDLGQPLEPARLFTDPVVEIRLEIGFGGGEHLAAQVAAHPTIGFIGCEPFRNGVVSLLQHVSEQPRGNLRIHADDAGEVIDALPDSVLSRIDLLYPDPWPKRRQRKRRFVSADRLMRFARVLRAGGIFRFATDIDDYAGWTLARVLACPAFAWTALQADDWRRPWPDWVPTRYEAKARREGRPSAYLTFVRR